MLAQPMLLLHPSSCWSWKLSCSDYLRSASRHATPNSRNDLHCDIIGETACLRNSKRAQFLAKHPLLPTTEVTRFTLHKCRFNHVSQNLVKLTHKYSVICNATIAHWKPFDRFSQFNDSSYKFMTWDKLYASFDTWADYARSKIRTGYLARNSPTARCWSVPQMPQQVTTRVWSIWDWSDLNALPHLWSRLGHRRFVELSSWWFANRSAKVNIALWAPVENMMRAVNQHHYNKPLPSSSL